MVKSFFHYISFFRFFLIGWGCWIVYPQIFNPTDTFLSDLGLGLLLCGLGMNLDSLRDDSRINRIDRKFYRNEKFTKIVLVLSSVMFLFVCLFSFYMIFAVELPQVGYGILAFGAGGISLMKSEYDRFNIYRNKKE